MRIASSRSALRRIGILLVLVFASMMYGQNTATLTGTVTDSDSTPWYNAVWTYTVVNPVGGQLVNVCGGATPGTVHGSLSSSGVFSGTLVTNRCISPGGTFYSLQICSITSAACQTLPQVVINVSSYNAGAFASANITAPRFTIPTNGVGFGYTTGEVNTPVNDGVFLTITNPTALCIAEVYTPSGWNCAAGGGLDQLTGDVTAGPGTGSQVATAVNLPGHISLTGTPATGDVPTYTTGNAATWQAPVYPVGCPNTSKSNALCYSYPNDGTVGTGLGLLACLSNGSGGLSWFHAQSIMTCPAGSASNGTDSDPPIFGVVVAQAGTTGNAIVQVSGIVPWLCDTQIAIPGYWLQPSSTVAGECTQVTGSYSPSPNEDPQGNSTIARAVVINTGAGTPATVALLPFGSYSIGDPNTLGGTNHYTPLALLLNGANFGSMSQMFQAPSTDPIPYGLVTNGLCLPQNGTAHCTLIGKQSSYTGQSGNDLTINTLDYGDNSPPDAMTNFVGGQYQVPSKCFTSPAPCSGSGTFTLGNHNNQFDPGNSSGLYVINCTGNCTTYTPLTDDNFGHVLTFVITPGASTAWTWPTGTPGFINAPTVANSTTPILSQFFFDGTNYQCLTGCATAAGGASGNNSNGYWQRDSTGTITQWQPTGITVGNDTTITFPVPFTNATSIQIQIPQIATISDVGYCFVIAGSVTTTQFEAHSANETSETCTFFAVGK